MSYTYPEHTPIRSSRIPVSSPLWSSRYFASDRSSGTPDNTPVGPSAEVAVRGVAGGRRHGPRVAPGHRDVLLTLHPTGNHPALCPLPGPTPVNPTLPRDLT